jgi:hypothetical protein
VLEKLLAPPPAKCPAIVHFGFCGCRINTVTEPDAEFDGNSIMLIEASTVGVQAVKRQEGRIKTI